MADDSGYYEETRGLLEHVYLRSEDPRGGSGFRGDEGRWEMARRPVVSAVVLDGTLLDVGCANGLLMESVARWGGEEGYQLEPYGLELIESLAAPACWRLPHWVNRVFTGNVMDWRLPLRFDFVRTELEYAPPHRRRELVECLLRENLVPGGRLIVCSCRPSRRPTPRAELVGKILSNWGYQVDGEAEGIDTNGVIFTRVAWTNSPET